METTTEIIKRKISEFNNASIVSVEDCGKHSNKINFIASEFALKGIEKSLNRLASTNWDNNGNGYYFLCPKK